MIAEMRETLASLEKSSEEAAVDTMDDKDITENR